MRRHSHNSGKTLEEIQAEERSQSFEERLIALENVVFGRDGRTSMADKVNKMYTAGESA